MASDNPTLSLARWLAPLALLVAAACSDADASSAPTTGIDTGIEDDIADDGDGPAVDVSAPDADTTPPDDAADEDTAEPPPPPAPAVVEVALTPLRSVYPTGLRVTPTVTVYDTTGAPLRAAPTRIEADPAEAATATDGAWTLQSEGLVTFRACVDDATLEPPVCGARRIVVDNDQPSIELTRPLPGAEITFDELGRVDGNRRGVDVEGRVSDSHGSVRVFVQGRPATLERDGTFRVRVPVEYGINHIDVLATDMLRPRETRMGASVLVADSFRDAFVGEEALSSSYPDALWLRLGQSFLDANLESADGPLEGRVHTRDLAGVLELLLQEIDLMGPIPDPVSSSPDFTLRVTDVLPGSARVDIAVTVRGVEIFVAIQNLEMRTLGFAQVGGQRLNLDGGASMSLSASVRLRLRTAADGTLDVDYDVLEPTLAVEDIVGRFGSPQANAIVAVAGSQLSTAIENVAISAVRDAFLDELPDLLRSAFEELTSLLEGQELDLDLGFGEPVTLELNGTLAGLVPTRRSDLTARLDLDLATNRPASFPDSRGIAIDRPSDEDPNLFASSRVQIAVRAELLNGLLHHLWNAGLLRIDASDVIPDNLRAIIARAEIDARLPPHLRAARPDELDYPLVLSLGQVELTIARGDREDRLGLDIRAGADARIEDGRLVVDVQAEPEIAIWLIASTGPTPLFRNPEDLRGILLATVWPELTGTLLTDLAIDLPLIDLSALGGLAPRLASFALSIVLDRPLALRSGFLVIEGGLDGVVDL